MPAHLRRANPPNSLSTELVSLTGLLNEIVVLHIITIYSTELLSLTGLLNEIIDLHIITIHSTELLSLTGLLNVTIISKL